MDESVNYHKHPETYRIGRGETGVLTVELDKSEILPHSRFKLPEAAEASAASILELYETYKSSGDFVGRDMARKFVQMGCTRLRRYTRHRSGRKYGDDGAELSEDPDPQKAQPTKVFKVA